MCIGIKTKESRNMPVYGGVYVSPEKDILEWAHREKEAGRIADVTIGEKTVGRLLAEEFGEYDPDWDRADEADAKLILMSCEERIMANFADIYGVEQTSTWLRGE